MQITDSMTKKLTEAFSPVHLQVINESHQHNVPVNAQTHFKIVLVSERFNDMTRLLRHQAVYDTLKEELAGPVHALSIQAFTPVQWETAQVNESPQCMGGSKK